MAKEDDLDLGVEQGVNSKKKLIIIIATATVLLLGVGIAAGLLLFGGDEEPLEESQPEVPAGPVSYHDMGPVFVANLVGKPRMLQVGLQLRDSYPELGEFLKHNDPALRHAILNLLSAQEGKTLQTREGKEALREALKTEINGLITKYHGPGEVEAVLFSSFVMQ